MNHTEFCNIAPFSLVDIHQLSAINPCFQLQSTLFYLENDGNRLLRNDGEYPPYCTVEHVKKTVKFELFFHSLFYDAFDTA